VRAVYASPLDDRLLVVDKVNGGKADSLNCGIRFAAYPLFCAIDSDTLLDPAALARLVWSFQAEPETVATGGIVRIVNGSLLEDGRLTQVHTPRSMLVNVQIMEYLRAFLAGRAGLVAREHAADHLGRLRAVQARDGGGGRRLRHHDRGRGRRADRAAAPALPRQGPALQDHLHRRPDLLDRGAGGAPQPAPAARPLAARAAGDAVAPSRDAATPAGATSGG